MASRREKTSGLANNDTSTGIVRPRFRERQLLRAADLDTEQSYLITARRRHNIGQHGWGIVQGLEIHDKPELVVQPGMAVDGYGRELIVTAPITIPTNVFTQMGDTVLDVWLVYQLVEANVPQRGSWSCGEGKNPRSREQITTLRLTPASGRPAEVPREPIEVPDADLPFLPHRTPPDDPSQEWPVYLGTLMRETEPKYDPRSPRPYATLTGSVLTPPSGRARMQVEAELHNDKRQFAVNLADSSGKLTERLGIDHDGNTYINGNTTVEKEVADTLVAKPVVTTDQEFNKNRLSLRTTDPTPDSGPLTGLLNVRSLAAPPAAPAPWQLYRTSVKEDPTKENSATIRQLRFEIFHPGDKGDPTSYRFAIGTGNADGFSSCFSLAANCNLTIEGNLEIRGQLVEGPIQADPTDERFAAVVAQFWVAATKVGEVTATTGTITGTVIRTDGTGIDGAKVTLTATGFNETVETDINGNYNKPLLPLGDYTVTASKPKFRPAMAANQKLAAFPPLNVSFALQPLLPIRGRVEDVNGVSVPNATVRITKDGDVTTITTNNLGRFEFEPLTDGPYSVEVNATGFLQATVTLQPGDNQTITLHRPRITGEVHEVDETPISGATVQFTHQGTGAVDAVTTGASGLFTFAPSAAGTYSVQISATGFVTQTVSAEPGDALNITMQRPPQPTNIRGNVIDAQGAAVGSARVEFRNQNTGVLNQVVTEVDGTFNSGLLTPGTYELRVSAIGFDTQVIVDVALGQTVTVTLQPPPIP